MEDSPLIQWFQTTSQDLHNSVESVVGEFGVILLGLAAVGVLASTVVNQLKDFVRPHYFRICLRRQLTNALSDPLEAYGMERFITAMATGQRKSFYKQDLAALFVSIGRVKNLAFNKIEQVDESEKFLLSWLNPKTYPKNYADEYKKDLKDFKKNQTADKKTSVNSAVDAQILGLKIRIENSWDRDRRWSAILIAVAIVSVFMWGTDSSVWLKISYGTIGGFLAPFSHDLLKNLRNAKVK